MYKAPGQVRENLLSHYIKKKKKKEKEKERLENQGGIRNY